MRAPLTFASYCLAISLLPAAASAQTTAQAPAAQAQEHPAAAPQQAPPATQPPAASATPFAPLTLNLGLEGYYEYNANRPSNRVNTLRAYDTIANSFSLQQASFVLESAPDRAAAHPFGLRLDLQFGQATEAAQSSPANEPRPNVYRNVWQAYGSYVFPGSRAVRMDFGKFASTLGFETNYAKDNNNFSRSLLFNFLPYYHEGVRIQAPLNDRIALSYVLSNGVGQTEDFNGAKSQQVAAVLTPTKAISWTINFYDGHEQPDNGLPNGPNGTFRVFDTYVTYSPTGKLSLGMDANHTTSQIQAGDSSAALDGFAGYGRYQAWSRAALALRYEFLHDVGGLLGGPSKSVQEITLTLEHKLGEGFLVRAEYRRDWSDLAFFPGRTTTDALKTSQSTGLFGLVWWLGGKTGAW